ncbi:MAG: ABC transporter permease [Spirochaetaceae bacterium]|nr:MAG: ABC transporter permease [Spirochaetaceae bacterium]
MIAYVLRRIVQGLIAVIIVLSIVFLVLNLSGDPVRLMLPPTASDESVAEMRTLMGLDRPLPVRYVAFLQRSAVLDFGRSIQTRRPAISMVQERLPATVQLSVTALFVATLIGVPLGMIAALRRGTWVDRVAVLTSMVGQSTPVFWIALLLIFVFGVAFPILPPSGFGRPAHLVLPSASIALFLVAGITRITRTSTIDVLSRPFVTVFRSRGLSERLILGKHVLRNAAVPIVTEIGLQLRFVIGGSVVVESIFGWPGIGQLLTRAAFGRDFPVVVAAVFVIALCIIAVNLLLDLLYSVIDPRIKVWAR